MQIEKLYVYPIKSLRAVSIDTAILTKFGFNYDRTFMILEVHNENGAKSYKNMTVAHYNEMVRFFPEIHLPSDGGKGTISITFKPLDDSEPKKIEMPLEPDTSRLELIDIEMHKSPTRAYRMDDEYNEWLSSCFGYECALAYIGENTREVKMSSTGYKQFGSGGNGVSNSWFSSVSTMASKASGMIMGSGAEEPATIKFSDVAPYLIVSSKSMDDVHRRLPDGEQYDITKFRPNVIVSGADEPWEEDFWAELTIGGKSKIECEHNCGRCRSINIDYDTGAQGTGEAGKMLKKLSSDRRVDKGTKWSPIFGRYAFLYPDSEGSEIKVGDEVEVTRKNKEHTAFDWKGLSTLPGGGRD